MNGIGSPIELPFQGAWLSSLPVNPGRFPGLK
jgi:hypothetical protein